MPRWIRGFVSVWILKCGNGFIKLDSVPLLDLLVFVFIPYKSDIHATDSM